MRSTIDCGRATRWVGYALLATLALGAAPHTADANPPPMAGVQAVPAWPGAKFTDPICLTTDGTSMFVGEQGGTIQRIAPYAGSGPVPAPALYVDLRGRVATGGQGGLLCLAFHPQFSANGRFFVSYLAKGTTAKFELRLSEFKGNATTCSAASEKILFTVPKSRNLHNAGGLAFGPDGLLYLSVGDNAAKKPEEQKLAQSPDSKFGKIFRLDVATPGVAKVPASNPWATSPSTTALPYLYAFGFRNPWRFDWDASGNMFTAEPGTKGPLAREWVTQVKHGHNNRWPHFEGLRHRTEVTGAPAGNKLVVPAFEYPSGTAGAAIGGKFYRGSAVPALKGKYVFCDVMRHHVYCLDLSTGQGTNWALAATVKEPSSIACDAAGELYVVCNQNGHIWKLIAK